jgi:hypothetical protein
MITEKITEKINGDFGITNFIVISKYIRLRIIIDNKTPTKKEPEMKFIRYK